MANYLDQTGLTYFWDKAKTYIGTYLGCGPVGSAPAKTIHARVTTIESDLEGIDTLLSNI